MAVHSFLNQSDRLLDQLDSDDERHNSVCGAYYERSSIVILTVIDS